MTDRRVPDVREFISVPEDHTRELAQRVNGVLRGQTNNGFAVTLRTNETTTEVGVEFARSGALAVFHPTSASAAASVATGTIWTEVETGKIVVHHDSSSVTDRTLGLVLVG